MLGVKNKFGKRNYFLSSGETKHPCTPDSYRDFFSYFSRKGDRMLSSMFSNVPLPTPYCRSARLVEGVILGVLGGPQLVALENFLALSTFHTYIAKVKPGG